jgi:hypothetical protein
MRTHKHVRGLIKSRASSLLLVEIIIAPVSPNSGASHNFSRAVPKSQEVVGLKIQESTMPSSTSAMLVDEAEAPGAYEIISARL